MSTHLDFLLGIKNGYLWFFIRLGLFRRCRYLTFVLRDNTKLKVRASKADGWAVWAVFLRKIYTPSVFSVEKSDVVIDIGAYIGTFSVLAGKKGAKVFSFEPIPDNFKLAAENIRLNGLKNVDLSPFGVAGISEDRRFFVPKSALDSCNLYNKLDNYVDVKCLTLKDIFKDKNLTCIDLLKMDCEGAEYEILFNTPQKVLRMIRRICLEYHSHKQHSPSQLKKFLEKNGFSVYMKADLDMMYAQRSY